MPHGEDLFIVGISHGSWKPRTTTQDTFSYATRMLRLDAPYLSSVFAACRQSSSHFRASPRLARLFAGPTMGLTVLPLECPSIGRIVD